MVLSRILITIFSPWTVGSVASRRSRLRLLTRSDTRPSCGMRFSAMFRSPMTLRRLISPFWMLLGECMTSWSTPSTRNRTRTSFSVGSMCTSEARSAAACVMIAWTSLTIGASSTAASTCVRSASVSRASAASDARAST